MGALFNICLTKILEERVMNNPRRKSLGKVKAKFEGVCTEIEELSEKIEGLKEEIECLKDEEESAYDNLPESLQESEKGESMQTAMEYMENAMYSVDAIVDSLQSATQDFEELYSAIDDAISCRA